MSIDFILSLAQAGIIAISLPIVAVILFYVIIPKLGSLSGSRFRRYLSYLITPPPLESEISESHVESIEQKAVMSWRSDKIKLYFYYLGIVLFITSFMIAEFYEVMIDLLLPVTQGSTGEMRNVTSIQFLTPFNAGWIGTLPWIGQVLYHETWDWIFWTAAFTDNPDFLGTVIAFLTLISLGVGTVFLVPLASKRIRHSFLPSMFFFMTGMSIFTKATTSTLAYAIALAFGNAQLEYGSLTATGGMIPDLSTVITLGLLFIIGMFALFTLIGRRLWKTHYTDSRSRNWFMVYIALSFCFWLVLTIMVV